MPASVLVQKSGSDIKPSTYVVNCTLSNGDSGTPPHAIWNLNDDYNYYLYLVWERSHTLILSWNYLVALFKSWGFPVWSHKQLIMQG